MHIVCDSIPDGHYSTVAQQLLPSFLSRQPKNDLLQPIIHVELPLEKGTGVMAKMKNLADAFYDELRDMYSAEKQLLKAIPKMAKKANCEKLTAAFEEHLEQTKTQVERVEKAFEETGKAAKAKTCEAMKGLITEAESMMSEESDPDVMDAILIGLAQKVEHYEIATYGTLCTWAEKLEYTKAKKLLGENLDEEEKTDLKLTKISKTANKAAMA